MASSSNSIIQDPLGYPERIEDGCNSGPSIRDKIHRLAVMINILRSFLRCTLKWHVEDKNVQVQLKQINDAVQKVIQDYQPLDSSNSALVSGNEGLRSSVTNEGLILSNLTKLKLIKSNMKEIHSVVVALFEKMDFLGSIRTKSIFWPLKIFPRSIVFSPLNFHFLGVSFASNVISFIDSILENLKDILCYKTDLITPVEEEIVALEDRLRFFRNFLWFIVKRCRSKVKLNYLVTFAEAVAVNIACLLYFSLVDDKMNENMGKEMKAQLVHLVQKIEPLQPETRQVYLGSLGTLRSSDDETQLIDEHYLAFVDYLIDNLRKLPNNQELSVSAAKDRMEILLDELRLLRFSLMDPPCYAYSKEVRGLMVQIKTVINKTGYFFYFFYANEMNEDMEVQLNLELRGILEEVECIKEKATECYDKFIQKSWRSNFPRTNQLGFIGFLIKHLKEQLHREEASIHPMKHQMELVYEELESMRNDFCEISEQGNEHDELNVLLVHFKDAAYHAEYVLDSFVAQAGSLWCHKLGLFEVRKEIRLIHKELKVIRKKLAIGSSRPVSLEANPPNIDALLGTANEVGNKAEEATIELVGVEVAAEKIIEGLTRGSKQLNILSIVGMPGIGKTTLATSVYNNHSVTFFFHARAWCCVSQVYKKETLLLEIFCQITGNTKQGCEIDTRDYVEKLRKSLKGKTYLIIIDDIWDIGAWNDLREIFPDDHNGSRILFTTRNHTVALKANSVPYTLSLLSDNESWRLLLAKVFEGRTCPSELVKVGKEIAKKCRGLPLAVVSIAGVLRTTERRKDSWKQVEESLRSKEVNHHLEQHFSILDLCYKHLPNSSKPCFLYFGAFPEDYMIPVSKLLWLWIAEGFMHSPNPSQNSLEKEAEKCLKDLISRTLVMVAQINSNGGVKSCRIHDLLRDFCLAKAKEENFLLCIKRYDQLSTTSTHSVIQQQYRLSIDSKEKHEVPRGPLRVHTLLFSFRHYSFRKEFHLVHFILKFKLLRVLDLGNVRNDGIRPKDFVKITNLTHLRFLAISIRGGGIPAQIENLQNLETLIITGWSVGIGLPTTIWNLVNLRHLHVKNGYFSFMGYSREFFDNSTQLDNLETLSTIGLFVGNNFQKLTSRLSSLRKLACILNFKLHDPLEIHLNQVQTLKLDFKGGMEHTIKFNPPSNLKKLTLSNLRRPWNEISVIGQLPNLEVLKLYEAAFVGRQWDMKDGEFQKLKFLKLRDMNIAVWNASIEHLPYLERLVLHGCLYLEAIPSALGESITLQLIRIEECSKSAKQSVREILKEQHEMGNYELKVSVIDPFCFRRN